MAKGFANLYPRIVEFENLWYAYRAAVRGKRTKDEVARFEFHVEERLLELERELANKTYRPGPYRSFYIRDPKRRLISAAPFRDRVVHHALCRVIEPIFEATFIADSFANRIGRGTHAALDRAQAFARRYRYVLQCDVREFFPSIDHEILRAILARKLACADTLGLCDAILRGGAGVLDREYTQVFFPGDDLLGMGGPCGAWRYRRAAQGFARGHWGGARLNRCGSLRSPHPTGLRDAQRTASLALRDSRFSRRGVAPRLLFAQRREIAAVLVVQ